MSFGFTVSNSNNQLNIVFNGMCPSAHIPFIFLETVNSYSKYDKEKIANKRTCCLLVKFPV
jgi:hypothetical protein